QERNDSELHDGWIVEEGDSRCQYCVDRTVIRGQQDLEEKSRCDHRHDVRDEKSCFKESAEPDPLRGEEKRQQERENKDGDEMSKVVKESIADSFPEMAIREKPEI